MENDELTKIKRSCKGMLSLSVYRAIYDAALSCVGTTAVEVGTSHGAATVCIAKGLRNQSADNVSPRLFTFDLMEGGTIGKYGTVDQNMNAITSNLHTYGVSESVVVTCGGTTGWSSQVGTIGLLMLDADGRIDRDLAEFSDNLRPGTTLIVDDCVDRIKVRPLPWLNSKCATVDLKQKATVLLIRVFINAGILSEGRNIEGTWFGEIVRQPDSQEIRAHALEAYRELVICRSVVPSSFAIKRGAFGALIARRAPALYKWGRALKRRYGRPAVTTDEPVDRQ